MLANMEAFYVQLNSEDHSTSIPIGDLVNVTHMNLKELALLTSELTWSMWG